MIKPTQKQIKTWLSMVATFGCVITRSSEVVLHHSVGRTYVKDKVQIGELFILPLGPIFHDNGNHPLNVTHHRKDFVEAFGMERDLFKNMVDEMVDSGLKIPFDDIYLNIIQKVRR